MTQRNPMNERSQAQLRGDKKGASRKSASSAKPASKAGASVREASKKKDEKKPRRSMTPEEKQQDKEEREKMRKREAALSTSVTSMPKYQRYRRIWWAVLIVAIAAVIISWALSALDGRDMLPPSIDKVAGIITMVTLGVGYIGIIAALIIDFSLIRPMRKRHESNVRHMSKRAIRDLDKAIERSEEEERQKRESKGSRLPWSKKKDSADEPEETTE